MSDVKIQNAVLLWDSGFGDETPRFAVRPLGHRDYDRFQHSVGACFADWQRTENVERLKLQLMVEVWHAIAFYGVPVDLVKPELLRIPEYRDMLADDVLPAEFRGERQ